MQPLANVRERKQTKKRGLIMELNGVYISCNLRVEAGPRNEDEEDDLELKF
jgi:hypothetical protein